MSTPEKKDLVADGWLRLQQSRTFIKQKLPYFFNTVLGFIPYHVPEEGTMFVNKRMILGVDMEWFSTVEVEVGAGCLIHEAMHILRDITRIEAMEDQLVAGYAFDMPINHDLRTFGIKLPPWVVYPETYGLSPGLTGEAYYELLMKMKSKLPTIGLFGAGRCGSCDGVTPENPIITDAGRSMPEVRYFQALGIRDLREHQKKGGFGQGVIPGSMRDFLTFDGTEEAIIPWQQVASSSMNQAIGRIRYGQSDYSLRRLSKRSYATGIPRPGLVTYEPTVVYIEDSSGSMGHVQLKENRVETAQMMRQLGITEAWFIQADVTVQIEPRRVTVADLMTLPVVGRGGTNFIHAINKAMELIPRPNLIVYSTDGDGPAPKEKPIGVEFIWLLAPGPWTRSPCKWGVQILTSNDRKLRKKYEIIN